MVPLPACENAATGIKTDSIAMVSIRILLLNPLRCKNSVGKNGSK
jgi:hypothetical protein